MFLAFHDSSVQIVHKGPSYMIYIPPKKTRYHVMTWKSRVNMQRKLAVSSWCPFRPKLTQHQPLMSGSPQKSIGIEKAPPASLSILDSQRRPSGYRNRVAPSASNLKRRSSWQLLHVDNHLCFLDRIIYWYIRIRLTNKSSFVMNDSDFIHHILTA